MADYTIADGAIAVHSKTLVADVEDTVTVPTRLAGVVDATVIVHPSSAGPVFVTAAAAAATVDGAHCRVVWPGWAVTLDEVAAVRLISPLAATYSVEVDL